MEELTIDIDRRLDVLGAPVYIRSMVFSSQRTSDNGRIFPYIKLYHNSEGTSELTINGTDKITVNKGEWALIDRNVLCAETVYGRCSGFELRIITDPKGSSLFPALSRERFCLVREGGAAGELLSAIRREYENRPRGYKEYAAHLLSALIITLSRGCGDREYVVTDRRENGPSDDTKIVEAFF